MHSSSKPMGWRELYLKEDWWAVYVGLGIVVAAIILYYTGNPFLKKLSVMPPAWSSFGKLGSHFSAHFGWYILQFIFFLTVFSASTKIIGFKQSDYIPSFIFVYFLSVLVLVIGQYEPLAKNGCEAPLVALILGLGISNLVRLPKWMDAGFRVEYYIKTGIVLLGATLPFTLVIWAGPIAFVQATIISITTCLVIYFVAHKVFGLDKRLGAVMGVGAAVCGVSAAIAVGGAVKAKKEHVSITIALVTIWAIIMIFFIPACSRLLGIQPGPAGAWIGSSEFADAAGFAAASAYGKMVGNEEAAVRAFTLMKVIGRDIWLGIWSFGFAMLACVKWEKTESGEAPAVSEIWWRLPKFIIGFMIASILITVIASHYSLADFDKVLKADLVGPIKNFRSWAFIFCFLCIGLTTRFRELASAGKKPFWAFTVGVIVNIILGFILSVYVLGDFWISKTAQ